MADAISYIKEELRKAKCARTEDYYTALNGIAFFADATPILAAPKPCRPKNGVAFSIFDEAGAAPKLPPINARRGCQKNNPTSLVDITDDSRQKAPAKDALADNQMVLRPRALRLPARDPTPPRRRRQQQNPTPPWVGAVDRFEAGSLPPNAQLKKGGGLARMAQPANKGCAWVVGGDEEDHENEEPELARVAVPPPSPATVARPSAPLHGRRCDRMLFCDEVLVATKGW